MMSREENICAFYTTTIPDGRSRRHCMNWHIGKILAFNDKEYVLGEIATINSAGVFERNGIVNIDRRYLRGTVFYQSLEDYKNDIEILKKIIDAVGEE